MINLCGEKAVDGRVDDFAAIKGQRNHGKQRSWVRNGANDSRPPDHFEYRQAHLGLDQNHTTICSTLNRFKRERETSNAYGGADFCHLEFSLIRAKRQAAPSDSLPSCFISVGCLYGLMPSPAAIALVRVPLVVSSFSAQT
jgi:hypothetical protein